MEIVELIHKKVERKTFTQQEIDYVIKSVVDGNTPDYLITSWLMVVYINGLTTKEAYYLTNAMWKYSEHIDLRKYGIDIVDKHSTGGIGDKVSLILLPIVAACGLPVAKISGRGLGFTGGTIDKLESIGVNTSLSLSQMINQLKNHKIFISGQTKNLVPSDKILYGLRSVIGAVDNYGLIASSILSKKFSILGTHVFLDVKFGSGAFCYSYKSALELIKYLKNIAKLMKRKLTIFVTNMNQPLGWNIGNALEILEAQEFLNCDKNIAIDLRNLILEMSSTILCCYNKKLTKKDAIAKIKNVLAKKIALNKFYEWVQSQGANLQIVKTKKYWHPKYKFDIKSPTNGYLKFLSTSYIGMICNKLGAGRVCKNDKIDYQAGMKWYFKCGDKVKKNDCLVTCYSSKKIDQKYISNEIFKCIKIVKSPFKKTPIIKNIFK